MKKVFKVTATICLLFPVLASAHTGLMQTPGMLQGFMHPFSGIDHLLAMLAIGIWAVQLGGMNTWLLPLTFIGIMAASSLLGMAGFNGAYVEAGILFSCVLLAVFITRSTQFSSPVSVLFVACFALFHGISHGGEMSSDLDGFFYMAGFVGATALLHALGIACGMLCRLRSSEQYILSAHEFSSPRQPLFSRWLR